MLRSKQTLKENWTLDRENSLQEAQPLALDPLLKAVSDRTQTILDTVQHVKVTKPEQKLLVEATACTEAFCTSYRNSVRQTDWPSNGVKVLLESFFAILEDIEQYIIGQMDKGRAIRFLNRASNSTKIETFLQRLENVVNRLENLENITESIVIAFKDSFVREIRPQEFPGPSPSIDEDVRTSGPASTDQGRTAPNFTLPASGTVLPDPPVATTAASPSTQPFSNECPLAALLSQGLVPPQAALPFIFLVPQEPIPRVLPITISISNIGNSDNSTTVG